MVDCRLLIAAAAATASVCITVASSLVADKYNLFVVNEVDFDRMHGNPKYDQWFVDNLRCSQRTFNRLCHFLTQEMAEYNLTKYNERHSFAIICTSWDHKVVIVRLLVYLDCRSRGAKILFVCSPWFFQNYQRR